MYRAGKRAVVSESWLVAMVTEYPDVRNRKSVQGAV